MMRVSRIRFNVYIINISTACQKRTLTPPDTWSCPTLGLACVLMLRPISTEQVLFSDFWTIHLFFFIYFFVRTFNFNFIYKTFICGRRRGLLLDIGWFVLFFRTSLGTSILHLRHNFGAYIGNGVATEQ